MNAVASPLVSNSLRRRQSGSVMIVAILILLVVTATALLLVTTMRVELRAAANHVEAVAAANAAEGAVRYVKSVLRQTPGQMPREEDLVAEGVIVGDAAFWLIRPASDSRTGYELGIADEAGKLNLNTATMSMLLELPGVTQEMAESLIVWRTYQDQAIDLPGADSAYYLLQTPPYLAKHSPLESVEELLLIRGWSRELLFSPADNTEGRPGSLPPARRSLAGSAETDAGLYNFLTVYSHELAAEDAVNVNDDDLLGLRNLLLEHLSPDRFNDIWLAVTVENTRYSSLLDFYHRTGLTEAEYDAMAPRLTIDLTRRRTGLVNVNTASETVLAALPGLDASDAAALVDARASRAPDEAGLGWIVDVIGDDKAFEVGPHLTSRSTQFTVDVVAIGRTGRAFKRYRVVLDFAGNSPRVLRWSDWTERGWPLDPALREALRSGMSLEQAVAMYGRVN